MSLKQLCTAFSCLLLISCSDSGQQEAQTTFHVGILLGVDAFEPTVTGFRDQMTTLGYREGKNIAYSIGRARGDSEKMTDIAKAYVKQRVDLVFTITNGATSVAKRVTSASQIPVVFAIVLAPVKNGIVDSLTRPSGNIIGVRNPLSEFIGKRLEIMRRIAPSIQKILVLNDPDYPTIPIAKAGLIAAAEKLNFKLIDTPVKTPSDVLSAIAQIKYRAIDAILIMPDSVVQAADSLKAILKFSRENKIPVIANTPNQADNGALFSYHTDSYQTGEEAAQLANRVLTKQALNGQPITSSDPQLVLNLKVAKALGLFVDIGLINLAHRIIE